MVVNGTLTFNKTNYNYCTVIKICCRHNIMENNVGRFNWESQCVFIDGYLRQCDFDGPRYVAYNTGNGISH